VQIFVQKFTMEAFTRHRPQAHGLYTEIAGGFRAHMSIAPGKEDYKWKAAVDFRISCSVSALA
jgi:hypothetical protein